MKYVGIENCFLMPSRISRPSQNPFINSIAVYQNKVKQLCRHLDVLIIHVSKKLIMNVTKSSAVREITEVTRRDIFGILSLPHFSWAGRLNESEFLSRVYNLGEIASTDKRFKTAFEDIAQHRDRNNDWADDWILFDPRFNLLYAKDETFIRFLCESVHPVVQIKDETVDFMVQSINNHLRKDGWEILSQEAISGRPVFRGRKLGGRLEVFDEPTGWTKVDRQHAGIRQQLKSSLNTEQFQTVGTLCREVLITLAETVYDSVKHVHRDGIHVSRTDAARMLEAYFENELKGSSNEELRAHAKAALKLANALQHKRTADFRMAALCAEATASTINVVAVVSGRRDN